MLKYRFATIDDLDLYFKWVNDELVRKNSLNTQKIIYEDHIDWFSRKISNPNVVMYLFFNEVNIPIGQVIIEKLEKWSSIGQSVAKDHRGKKYSSEMLTKSTNDFLNIYPKETIVSVVKAANIASLKMAEHSGFILLSEENREENILVLKGYKQKNEDFIAEAKRHYNLI